MVLYFLLVFREIKFKSSYKIEMYFKFYKFITVINYKILIFIVEMFAFIKKYPFYS